MILLLLFLKYYAKVFLNTVKQQQKKFLSIF
jgi:hypothetical protein